MVFMTKVISIATHLYFVFFGYLERCPMKRGYYSWQGVLLIRASEQLLMYFSFFLSQVLDRGFNWLVVFVYLIFFLDIYVLYFTSGRVFFILSNKRLTHFSLVFHFYNPRKSRKPKFFRLFLWGKDMVIEHWTKMGEELLPPL